MSEAQSPKWVDISLGQLAKGYRGVSYRPEHLLGHSSESSVTLLRATNIQNGSLTFEDVQYVPAWLVAPTQCLQPGDIAVCMSNGSKSLVGKSAPYRELDERTYTVGAFCSIFKPVDRSNSEFIRHLFNSQTYQKSIDFALAGSAINNLKNSSIENTLFHIPTDKEIQHKIAAILTSIDTAIEKTEALIEKYQQIKAGLMHDLFTRGVLPNGQLRPTRDQAPELYHETAIGWIPKDWESINLGRYIEINLYGPRFDAGDYDETGNVKTIRGTDFSKDGEIKYSQAPVARLPAQKINRHILKAGDVVVVTTADCGLTAVFEDQDFCFIPSAYAVKYRFLNSVNPYFIKYFMQTDMAKRQVNKYVRQGTLGNLPGSDLLRFSLGLPQQHEQNVIVLRLDSIKIKIATEQKILDKLLQQKFGLMQDLLTGKVPVNVNGLMAEAISG